MRIALSLVTAAALAAGAAIAVAQDNPIEARQALMKANGQALGQLGKIAKGENPYDAAVVTEALEKLAADAKMLDADKLFPPGSDTGAKNAASPKIWEDMDGFKAEIEELRTVTAAALAAAPAVGAQVGKIGQACTSCHETYRLKTD